MNAIRRKLRSDRGASITFALILFLVCAVAGSVILAAGTAAAGRLSGLAESDRRYYSVTSAAELLKKELDNKGVRIVTTQTTVTTTDYDYNGNRTGSVTDPGMTETTIDGAAVTAGYQPASILAGAAYRWKVDPAASPALETLQISASDGSGRSVPSLTVRVEQTLGQDGTLTLLLRSADTASGGAGQGSGASRTEVYSLRMTLQAEQTERTDSKTETGTPQEVGADGYRIETRTTQVTTTDLIWKLTGIQTVTGGS